jgi:NAD dependent epimerase/dehydratase family enzyme
MLLSSHRAVPRTATEMGYRFAYPTIEDAFASLR